MFEHELAALDKKNLLRRIRIVESYNGARVRIDGKSILLMCSNDYLGLANHPLLREAAHTAMERYGFGAGASRLVSGTGPLHRELEVRTARFKGAEAAILFNSGYAANTGIIPAIAEDGDVIISDSLNHASIIDGCRLSRARVLVYRHRDVNHVEKLLKSCSGARRRLVITDGVFSMDGDVAPLPELVSLSEKYDAMLMVDDAHATGVFGKSGKGTAEHFGLEGRVAVQMGTFSKAMGSFGAYAAGSGSVIDFFVNRSRSYIFSTALPPAVCGATLAAMDILENDHSLRVKLWRNRERFVDGLSRMGVDYGKTESPIIPLIIGSAEKALTLANKLFELGIFATAIRPPAVAEGASRVRMTVMATHEDDDIDTVLNALKLCKQEGLC